MSKLLIIDDDQLVANIYRNRFTVEGYQVEIALDGEEGFEQIQKFRPDVVILDLILPKLPGVELLRRVRATKEFENLPVIVFSNTYLSNTVQEAWKAGATKCLSKASCTPKQLLRVARETLSPPPKTENQTPAEEPEPASVGVTDFTSLAEVRSEFLAGLPATLTALRTALQGVVRAPDEAHRVHQLSNLHGRFHLISSNAGVAGLKLIAGFGEAAEALARQLLDRPSEINASTLRTLAAAVDFVGWLFDYGSDPAKQDIGSPKLLVVDDDDLSRHAVSTAIEKVKLTATCLEDPFFAIKMAAQSRFDLIILDVDMPGMNGFELCSKLRATQMHKGTPIIFVTGLSDFESRANSTISGGNDLIAKPFLLMELALKALTHVIRRRLAVHA